jgi:hypothetical protein
MSAYIACWLYKIKIVRIEGNKRGDSIVRIAIEDVTLTLFVLYNLLLVVVARQCP